MSLRYAILGYLSTGPGTGYDLARQFDTGLGWFWSARHSQIYPELKRLTEDGLITRDTTMVSENMDKYIYSIAPEGLAVLRDWASKPPTYAPNRDTERLQLIFSDDSPESLRKHLETHRDHFRRRREKLQATIDTIRAGEHERVNSRLARRGPEEAALTLQLREMAYVGDIERADLEIAWAERGLAWLDSHEHKPKGRQQGAALAAPQAAGVQQVGEGGVPADASAAP
ncbi:PadR family transcriptional regulator [Streptomyces bluensis]|uniref:PadR family transcriptional regulator n=1 Tax=Streptomyces bluensis TaxID=33897 RepID=A0ABW6US05_9ACTN